MPLPPAEQDGTVGYGYLSLPLHAGGTKVGSCRKTASWSLLSSTWHGNYHCWRPHACLSSNKTSANPELSCGDWNRWEEQANWLVQPMRQGPHSPPCSFSCFTPLHQWKDVTGWTGNPFSPSSMAGSSTCRPHRHCAVVEPNSSSAATMAGAVCHLMLNAKGCSMKTGDWQARGLSQSGAPHQYRHKLAASFSVLRNAAATCSHLCECDLPTAKLPDRVLPGSCSARHCHCEGAEGWQLVTMAASLPGHLQPVQ